MNRRGLIPSAIAFCSVTGSKVMADSIDLMFVGIQRVVIDVERQSNSDDLRKIQTGMEIAATAVEALNESLQSRGKAIVAVNTYKTNSSGETISPLSILFATIRVDLTYSSTNRTQVIGAVGIFLQHTEYGAREFRAPWSFLQVANDPVLIKEAISRAVREQMTKLSEVF